MTAINERKKAYVIAYLKSRSFAINAVAFDIPLGSAKKQEKQHKKSPSYKTQAFFNCGYRFGEVTDAMSELFFMDSISSEVGMVIGVSSKVRNTSKRSS